MKICAVHIILWPAKCFQKSLTAPLNSYCIFLKKTFSRIFQARIIFNARCFQKRFFIFLGVCAEGDQDNWIEYCCSDHFSILVKSCLNPSSNFLVLCVSFPWRRLETFLIFLSPSLFAHNCQIEILTFLCDFYTEKQGNYSLRRPPKLIIPQAVIRHWEKMSFCMHIDV